MFTARLKRVRGKTCGGLSLVELLVSMTLGLLLSAAMVKVYVDSKAHYRVEQATARIQENGRFALGLLARELALAGFYAGNLSVADMPAQAVMIDCPATGEWALDASVPVDMINGLGSSLTTTQGASFENCLTASKIQAGTDLLSLKRTAMQPTVSWGEFTAGVTALEEKQWYLRVQGYGDVKHWVFIPEGGLIPAADAGSGSSVEYWEMQAKIFYIRRFSSVSSDTVPTLCVEKLVGSAMATECLVEGVEDMQVEFGVDIDGDGVPDQYQKAPSGAQLSAAVTARLYLLLRSINPITGYSNSKTYTLGQSAPQVFNDGYLRRVFSKTVRLSNVIRSVTL